MVITDASLVGGGGTFLQWQRIPGAAAKRIVDELNTVGVNSDGSLKHNYDPQEFHLVPIGHWNWEWSSTRANYSTYERESLSEILLISGQSRLFGSNSASVTLYPGMSMENQIWQPQTILGRRSKFSLPKFDKSYVEGRWLLSR